MERVDLTLRRDRVHGRGERLAEDLATEDRPPPEVLALAAEQVLFDALEREELHQLVQDLRHGGRV